MKWKQRELYSDGFGYNGWDGGAVTYRIDAWIMETEPPRIELVARRSPTSEHIWLFNDYVPDLTQLEEKVTWLMEQAEALLMETFL